MSAITLFLGGDVMTGRGIDQILRHPGDPTLHEQWSRSALDYVRLAEQRSGPLPRSVDPSYIWGEALELIDESQPVARIVNLETAVTDQGEPRPGKGVHYRMHPANVGFLTAAGIDCCVLANNHVLDWSYPGLEQTLSTLGGAGLVTAGAGIDAEAARRPAVIDVGRGARVVVVAVGATSSGIPRSWEAGPHRPGVAVVDSLSSSEVDLMASSVAQVARSGDLVVCSIHWGSNWGYAIPRSHRRFAHHLIDRAGVHLVHGHSSHHPLAIEVYRNRPIIYGCGDLINDYEGIAGHQEYRPDLGILYLMTMDSNEWRLHRLELVPVRRHRFRLVHASTEETRWLQDTLTRQSEELGTSIERNERGGLFIHW